MGAGDWQDGRWPETWTSVIGQETNKPNKILLVWEHGSSRWIKCKKYQEIATLQEHHMGYFIKMHIKSSITIIGKKANAAEYLYISTWR